DAGADPNRKDRVTTIDERKHADHPTGGMTALMFASREGHADTVTALVKGGADPKVANGDNVTAPIIAIVNDRFDLAAKMIELGSDPNDGSLYFAVDMHDATTDMRAHDGSRLRVDYANTLTSLDLVKLLLDKGADPNKAFVGQLHNISLCCDPEINSSAFYRAAQASDVEALKLMIAKAAKIEWSPTEVKKGNLTPLLLAEKPEPPPPPGNNNDPDTYKPPRDTRDAVIAALREMMHLGKDDPAPVPPPLPKDEKKDDKKKAEDADGAN